jgi:competence protein ComEA
MLKGIINSYFGFNRRQRNGLLVLCILCFLLLIVRIVYPYFLKNEKIIINDLPLIADSVAQENSITAHAATVAIKLNRFDPNKVNYEELLSLGLSEKVAKILLKFRVKGFVFRKKEDLKKVYGISDKKYAELEPYIIIAGKNGPDPSKENLPEEKKKAGIEAKSLIDINIADSAALTTINGIGPAFARRIIKYREILGGYANPEQLKEVFGFTAEMFEKIGPQVKVNSPALKKLNLNKDDFKTINRHPYISYEQTKAIFDQKRSAPINEEILKEILQDNSLFGKLSPYIEY